MTRSTLNRLLFAAAVPVLGWPLAGASLPAAKPEEVGLSSERLQKIHEMVMRRVDAGELSGAVTLVARRGKVVHFEAHGVMDLDSKKPMTTDALFRLASSSKPVTAAAILILLEDGKLKLTDPVSKYIPEFKNPKVAMTCARERSADGGSTAGHRAADVHGAGPARDHDYRPADPHLGPGHRRRRKAESQKVQQSLKAPRHPGRLHSAARRRFRSISSPERSGATAGSPASTPWAGSSRLPPACLSTSS